MVGVDHSQVSRIERGEMSAFSKNVQKLCKRLKVDPPQSTSHVGMDPSSLGRRVQALVATNPAAAPAIAAMVNALEALAESSEGGV